MAVETPEAARSIDDLLAKAIAAVEALDPRELERPLEVVDDSDPVADVDELTGDEPPADEPTTDELRRLTIMFSDMAGSTALSGELDPETYRRAINTYVAACRQAVEEFGGTVVHTRGDGVLVVFGHPVAHDDDADRAVRAGLRIHELLAASPVRAGDRPLEARVGIHRGLVYVEHQSGEPYGLAVNVAARVQDATPNGTVAMSDEVRSLVGDDVRTVPIEAGPMKGVVDVPALHQVVAADPDVQRPRRGWTSPLVGRQAAVDRMIGRIDEARTADRPLTLGFVGDAGIGKSRLVAAALETVDRAVDLVRMEGSPRRRQGLSAVRTLVRSWAGIGPDLTPRRELARLRALLDRVGRADLLELLAPVVGIAPEAGYEPVSSDQRKLQAEILDAVHQLMVQQLSPARDAVAATVLWVEDLHWVDSQTLAVLERLVAEGPAGLLVVLTSREPITMGEYTVVERVGPLTDDEVVALVHHLDAAPSTELLLEVIRQADGVPLFVEELVRARTSGEVAPTADDSAIPTPLYDSLYARLAALSNERLLISAAATLGRAVPLEVLAAVAGQPADWLDRAVATLIDHRVFDPDHGDGRTVRFRHELVRQVAYELEPPSGRRRLHARAAEELAKQGGGVDWMRVAHHRQESGDAWGAVDDLRRAADDARRRGSIEEARSIFDHALEVLAEVPTDAARDRREVELRLDRAFLAVSSEGFASEHAAEDYGRCLELAVDHPASDEMYRTLIALWGYFVNRSDLEAARSVSVALKGLSQGHRAPMLPTNAAGFGMIQWYRGAFDDAVQRLSDSVADMHLVGVDAVSLPSDWTMPLDPLASMHIHHALARFWVGDIPGADESYQAARERCTSLAFPVGPFTDVYCLLLGTWMDAERDDPQAALDRAGQAAAIAERHGFEAWSMWAVTAQTALGALADPGDEAVIANTSAVESYLDLWHAIGVHVLSGSIHSVLARALLAADKLDEARAIADIGIDWAHGSGSVPFVSDLLRVRALAGDPAEREQRLLDALATAQEQGAVVSAVRIAGDLVRVIGPQHRPRLDEALARLPAAADLPVAESARASLTTG